VFAGIAQDAALAGFSGGSPHGAETVITGEDHLTSVMFSINDSVGALRNVLEVFERHDVSMTHIQSRPNAKKYVQKCFCMVLAGFICIGFPPAVTRLWNSLFPSEAQGSPRRRFVLQ